MISIDDFHKVEMRVGEILSAEPIEGSEKLLKLTVNFGSEERQVVSGIRTYVEPTSLVGRRFAFATNLEPRVIMGLESQAMILAVGGDDPSTPFDNAQGKPLGTSEPFAILEAPGAAPGSRVK